MLWFFVWANILVLGNVVNFALAMGKQAPDQRFLFFLH